MGLAYAVLGLVAALTSQRIEIDLDDDGVPEVFVAERGSCGSSGCDWKGYKKSKAGLTLLVRMRGQRPQRLKEQKHGRHSIFAQEHGGTLQWTERIARFDGEEYAVAARDCRIPTSGSASRPRCTAWRPDPP
jgi:hypothetical protein